MSTYITAIVGVFILIYNSIAPQDLPTHFQAELPYRLFETSTDTLTIEEVLQCNSRFKSIDYYNNRKTHPKKIYWIKIDLTQQLNHIKDSIWYLVPEKYDYASVYYNTNGNISEKMVGRFQISNISNPVLHYSDFSFTTKQLIDNRYIYLKIKYITKFKPISSIKFYYTSPSTILLQDAYYDWEQLKMFALRHMFSGVCLIVFILTFAFFIISKRTEFLFYSLYVFWLFVYLTGDVFRIKYFIFGDNRLAFYWVNEISQVFINLCYVIFVSYYLSTKTAYPKLNQILKTITYVLVFIIGLDSIFFLFNHFEMNIYVMNIQRIIMTIFGIGGMIYLIKYAKNHLTYFIVCGSFLYMIGALALMFFKKVEYMILGGTLEITIFAIGLAYKVHQEYKAKLYFQKESFINNNKALRSQINPHFIFNSLVSIQHLILSDKKDLAIQYLSKFSSLTRKVLDSSFEDTVFLSEEIKLLKQYIELERLRFHHTFNYTINIQDELEPDTTEVPMLIVQPFVENAILHGLLNKKDDDKQLTITFRKEESCICCEVDDNGIGRKASIAFKTLIKHKVSRGIEVTSNRLKNLNTSVNNQVRFIDKTDDNGNEIGTTVIIKIPIQLDFD